MNGENVGHFNVQSRFSLGVKIVELVDVEVGLCVLDGNHYFKLASLQDDKGPVNKWTYSVPRYGPVFVLTRRCRN